MLTTQDSSRPRRPLSFGEVAMVAVMVVIVFGLGLYLPSLTIPSANARQATVPGISLMNVQQTMPTASKPTLPEPTVMMPISETMQEVTSEADLSSNETQPVMSFDGRPLRRVRQMTMLTTAYSPDERSCGKWADGFTASGYSVWTNGMKLVAADTSILPFGTIVTIPGYNNGKPVQVLDRGGKIKGHRLDLLYPTHRRALQWGAQRLTVDVWEYAD